MCNLTNCDSTENFIQAFGGRKKANFLKPALMNLSTERTRDWFESHGLSLVERDDGKVFPRTLKAQSVVDCLKKEARGNNVEIRTSRVVKTVAKKENIFTVKTDSEEYQSRSLLIATGGKGYESTGSDGSGYALAKSLGHKIIEPTQALVSINVEDYHYSVLAGNSIRNSSVDFFREGESKRYLNGRGDLLFTHKGISGPVILNNSRDIRKNDLIKASLVECENREHTRDELHNILMGDPRKQLGTVLKSLGLFSSLVEEVLSQLELNVDDKCANLNKKNRNRIISLLLDCPFKVSRKGYFSSSMVTAGGVDLGEVNRKTMESKLVDGLYFAGEVLDFDGNTGGYNIQAAFSTAYLISLALK